MNFDISPAWTKLHAMGQGMISLVPNLLLALILFSVFWVVAKWVKRLIERFCHRRGHQSNVGLVIGRLGAALIVLLGLLVSLSVVLPSFKAADLIQVLGLSSVAIGFAFRDILQNFLAGILILLAQPFRIGEEISVSGVKGVVQQIQARATLLKTSDGFLVVIPNATIYTQNITVFNAYDAQRTVADLVIAPKDDIELARRLALEAMRTVAGVLEDPAPNALVTTISDRGVNLQLRWWTDAKRSDDAAVLSQVIPAVREALAGRGIFFPHPTRRILFDAQKGTDDVAVAAQERGDAGARDADPGRMGERRSAGR